MKNRNEQFYESPQMKMVEIKARQVLCGSGDGNLQQYNNGSWSWESQEPA